jgi:hypothetical protein
MATIVEELRAAAVDHDSTGYVMAKAADVIECYIKDAHYDAKVIAALRARERAIIDYTWGYACNDGSVPSSKIQDKIIAAIEQTVGKES